MRGQSWTPEGNLVVALNTAGSGLLLVPMAGCGDGAFQATRGSSCAIHKSSGTAGQSLFTLAASGSDAGELHVTTRYVGAETA